LYNSPAKADLIYLTGVVDILGGFTFTFTLPLIDFILKKLNIHNKLLRFITHFFSMNIALFIGFFKFASGVKSGTWNPTKRNQLEKKD